MRTAQDFIDLTAKIQMDLRAANAKMTELRAWIAALPLPEEKAEFSEERFLTFVRNTAHVYTDASLEDEIRSHGGTDEFVAKALKLAGEVRGAV